jgi:predicted Fe-Mo cluster-binding NifX family protein
MKIAFSATNDQPTAPMDSRFGRAAGFLLFDTDTKMFSYLKNAFAEVGQGAGAKVTEALVKAGVDVVVTGACGPKAARALALARVKAFAAKDCSVNEALAAFNAGKLEEMHAA